MSSADTVIIIPSRYASSRLPGKPIALIAGKTMLERVWRNGCAAIGDPSTVIIATDDQRIKATAEGFGATVVMTPESCTNGSERVFEASKDLPTSVKFLINLQGDSPLLPPAFISALIEMRRSHDAEIATLSVPLSAEQRALIRSKDKKLGSGTYVITDRNRRALYFSRYPIPFVRDADEDAPLSKHVGIYAYTRASLEKYLTLAPSMLENSEKLEQLRALEAGMSIAVKECDLNGRTLVSVDTPEDLVHAEAVIKNEGELLS